MAEPRYVVRQSDTWTTWQTLELSLLAIDSP